LAVCVPRELTEVDDVAEGDGLVERDTRAEKVPLWLLAEEEADIEGEAVPERVATVDLDSEEEAVSDAEP